MDVCHTGTRDLAGHVGRADVVIAAAGAAGIVTAQMVRPGAVVVIRLGFVIVPVVVVVPVVAHRSSPAGSSQFS